jgi:hypothetical protein
VGLNIASTGPDLCGLLNRFAEEKEKEETKEINGFTRGRQ